MSKKKPPSHSGDTGRRPNDVPPREGPPPEQAGSQGQNSPPGLGDARHAAAQRVAESADVLRRVYVPASMAVAAANPRFDAGACRAFLDRFVEDAGSPHDPVHRVLLEQVAFAHLRLADLHAQAATAKQAELIRVYSSAAARLFGEIRRTAMALREYRGRGHAPTEVGPQLAEVG
jgi:hypothetical protein